MAMQYPFIKSEWQMDNLRLSLCPFIESKMDNQRSSIFDQGFKISSLEEYGRKIKIQKIWRFMTLFRGAGSLIR